jgi:hypothetical protein
MPQFFFLGLQILCGKFVGWDFDRYALDDFQTSFLQGAQLPGIVRDHPHLAQAQIEKNLGALAVLAIRANRRWRAGCASPG